MVDIVRINSSGSQVNRIPDRASPKASEAKASSGSSSSLPTDTLDIGTGAREASIVKRLISIAQSEPNVRAEAIAVAKEKLSNGDFEGIEVSRDTAKRILGIT